MGDLDPLDRLARAYDAQVHAVRAALEAFAAGMWESMPDYRDDAVEAMVAAIVPRVVAGQLRTAELTRAYLVACAQELGWDTDLPPVDAAAVTGLRGTPPEEVYRRPALQTWTALSQGKALDDAVRAGGLRLHQLIGGDLQNAKRVQSRDSMTAAGGTYYRRILTGRENCALCTIASTQRYRVEKLLPIHPGCDCGVGPLPAELAMDQVIDEALLEAVHDAVEATTGTSDRGARSPDYRDIILETTHGEYGPVISFKGTRTFRRKSIEAKAPQPERPTGPPRKPPKRNSPTPESDDDRYRRQQRLKSELSALEPTGNLPREVLDSREIDFLERFEARGERVRWIRRDRAENKPTDDFVWITNGDLSCELKSTGAKYKTIKRRIQDAVNRASAHGTHGATKRNFVIDLGPYPLTDKLRLQLGRYNTNVQSGRIRRLFVMSLNGTEFVEIPLL